MRVKLIGGPCDGQWCESWPFGDTSREFAIPPDAGEVPWRKRVNEAELLPTRCVYYLQSISFSAGKRIYFATESRELDPTKFLRQLIDGYVAPEDRF